jgi:TetR/AcrR family transcriptional regulator, transcriptional repressor of bet genes
MPGRRAPEEKRREQIVSAAYAVSLRTGVNGVTLRAVAAEAKLSHSLVIFYFRRKDQLIDALLDRLLATTAMVHVSRDVSRIAEPSRRFAALLRQEVSRLSQDPRGTRLFLEYWALGLRQKAIRRKIAAALERYREGFRASAEEVLAATEHNDSDPSPASLATVAVGLITGVTVQTLMDPKHVDTAAYLATVETLVEGIVPNGRDPTMDAVRAATRRR